MVPLRPATIIERQLMFTYRDDISVDIDSILNHLKKIADDMYIVLINEIGPTSITREYEHFLENNF